MTWGASGQKDQWTSPTRIHAQLSAKATTGKNSAKNSDQNIPNSANSAGYPLVIWHSYGKSTHFSWVNPLFQWPFSIGFPPCKLQRPSVLAPRGSIQIGCRLDPGHVPSQVLEKKPWISVGPPIERIDFFMGVLLMSIRKKFRSETSDNMESWKAEVRRVRRDKIRRKKR